MTDFCQSKENNDVNTLVFTSCLTKLRRKYVKMNRRSNQHRQVLVTVRALKASQAMRAVPAESGRWNSYERFCKLLSECFRLNLGGDIIQNL